MGRKTTRGRRAAEGRSRARTGAATGELRAHPLAEQFPLMEGAEYERFKRDIARNGLIDPITVHDGLILDGRHRYRACRELGIEPRTVEWDGTGSIVSFVCSRNAHRRQLTDGGRAMIAARIANLKPGRPGKTASIEAVSQTQAAELLGVSRTAVQHATTVIGCGDATLEAMVRRGEVAVSAAAAVADLPDAERAVVVARGAAAIARRAAELRRAKAEGGSDGAAPPQVDAAGGSPGQGPGEHAEGSQSADAATSEVGSGEGHGPGDARRAGPANPTRVDAEQGRSEAVTGGGREVTPPDEPASGAAAHSERAAGAATHAAAERRDPGRYPLRERLADPTIFDLEVARYFENADSLARRGGPPAGEAYMRIYAAATSPGGQSSVSIRLDVLPPPEE